MIDLDRFKQVNDQHGHRAGDRVLKTVGACLREALRAEDIYGRWGGDEFLVLLPGSTLEDAEVVASRLRKAAAEHALPDIGLQDGIKLSVGAASAPDACPEELVHSADLALYQAKAGSATRRSLRAS